MHDCEGSDSGGGGAGECTRPAGGASACPCLCLSVPVCVGGCPRTEWCGIEGAICVCGRGGGGGGACAARTELALTCVAPVCGTPNRTSTGQASLVQSATSE